MTLTKQKTPALVSLSGNDILFKIHTDNQISVAGGYAILALEWSAGDSVGNSFTITFGNTTVEFSAVASPDESGYQYPAYSSGDVNVWKESLVEYFEANYLIHKNYHVAWMSGTSQIHLTGRVTGTSLTADIAASGSNVSKSVVDSADGVDAVYREDYRILCRVFKALPLANTLLGEDLIEPDSDGDARFRIQEYLKDLTESQYTYPEDPDNPIVEQAGMISKYFIEYAEKYAGDVKKLFTTEDTITFVIGGTVDQLKEKQYADLEISFFDELQGAGMFLSWHPLEKTISTWQPEKLYYINAAQHATLKFRIKKYWTDGTSTISLIESVATTEDEVQVYEICCGHDQLQLNLAVKTLDYYEIYVEDGDNNLVSEIRKFTVDSNYHEFEKVFFFRNSLDAYETFRTTGVHEKSNEFEHNLVEKMVLTGDLLYSQQSNDESWLNEIYVGNSGWITRDELDWTNEFIISRERFLIEDYRMIPVLVTSTKVFQHKDDDKLYSIEFEYKIPLSEKAYSNRHSIDPWRDESGQPILTEDSELILV